MSTVAVPEDEAGLKDAIARVRQDTPQADRQAWVAIGHIDKKPNVVGVVKEGEDLQELLDCLASDEVMYCLVRLTSSYDMSTTVKFIYIRWMGEDVAAVKRGRYGVVHGSLQQYFVPYHLQIEANSSEEVTEEALQKKLDEGSGVRSKVIEGSVEGRQERGFTQHAVKRNDRGEVIKTVAPAGRNVQLTPELEMAIAEVRDDAKPITWVVAGFEDGDPKKALTLVGSGLGDIEDLKELLQDDQVHYCLYRTGDCIDDINTVKFVYIYWLGDDVKPITKGKVSAITGPVQKIFSPAHVTLSFTSKNDINNDIISDKVTASSGSKSFVK